MAYIGCQLHEAAHWVLCSTLSETGPLVNPQMCNRIDIISLWKVMHWLRLFQTPACLCPANLRRCLCKVPFPLT